MTDQGEAQKPTAPEGRYRYLADFSRQESPNLRKLYHDSREHRGLSNRRSSPSRSRQSPYSSNKRRPQRLSPSCSTFNPRREMTQQQFSPYDDRAGREEERFNLQLREENAALRTQLLQVTQLNQRLRAQLERRDIEVIRMREKSQDDLKYFEKVVAEMTGEIQLVLTKNKILQNELTVVKARLHEEIGRQEDLARIEGERRKLQQFRRQQSRDEKKITGQLTAYAQPQSRRSVGKLMSRPAATQSTLGTSKIKIEEDLEAASEKPLNQTVTQGIDKQTKKMEQLIQSIRSMFFKITGTQSSSLRELWKWLKSMGHAHSCLKRWKSRAQSGSYLNVDRLRELIKQGCSYIQ